MPDAIDYLETAYEAMLEGANGLFSGKEWMPLIQTEIRPCLADDDVIDIFMPIVYEFGASSGSVANQEGVKPTGDLLVGALVMCQDRAILAWSKGMIKLRMFSEVIPYASVQSVAPFTMSTKMEQLPSFEVFTGGDGMRRAFTFSNNLVSKRVDVAHWRDRMVHRFQGWQPEFEGRGCCAMDAWFGELMGIVGKTRLTVLYVGRRNL